MSANISINKDGQAEMFSGQNIVPWHKLGTVVDGFLSSEEAIIAANLGWEVEKRPLYLPDGVMVPGWNATVRMDSNTPLGVVKDRYEVIQNVDAFDFFDSVVESKDAMYDTAGALGNGEVVWIMAKVPGQLFVENNPDDKIDKNILLVTSHNGSHSLTMQIVATRVVCSNTLSIALAQATNQVKIWHTINFDKKVQEAQKALKLTHAYFDDLQGLINELSKKPMTQSEMADFSKALLPYNGDKDEEPMRLVNRREKINDLFVNGRGNLGRSRWDALNAVTEYVDFHIGTRGVEDGTENRFRSSLLGQGAKMKERAVSLLV